jgi:putative glutamine amidotransferase
MEIRPSIGIPTQTLQLREPNIIPDTGMNQRPSIGIPTQTLQVIDGIPSGLPDSWVMNQRYYRAVASVGGVPWMIPLLDNDTEALRLMYERLDGVFIAGGIDVDPSTYGAPRHVLTGRSDTARDRVEMLFVRWALEDGKPVLGVCRGAQIINVVSGGTLYQDLADELPDADKHDYFPTEGFARDYLAHSIRFTNDSCLRSIFGSADVLVNSMHHQAIREVGTGLRATAFAPDGVIEAVEGSEEAFVVGVQWHPEMLVDKDAATHRLFSRFIAAANEYRLSRLEASVV